MDVTETALQLDRPAALEARPDSAEPAYRKALIPLDGSAVAEAVVPVFMRIAQPLGLEIVLLRVLQLPSSPSLASPSLAAENIERLQQEATQYLSGLADSLRARGMRVETTVRSGDPATGILDAAREVGADLIAMTTHGRSGLGRLLFGSVAEAVLRHSHLPVFLVRVTDAEAARHAASR